MYAFLWRHLPGGRWARSLQALLLAAVAVAVLFLWVFPAVTPYLPYEDVTVTPAGPATPSPTSTLLTPPTGASP